MEIGPDKTKVVTNNQKASERKIKIKGQRLEVLQSTLSIWNQSSLMKVQNQRFFPGIPRQQQPSFYNEEHMDGQEHLACF